MSQHHSSTQQQRPNPAIARNNNNNNNKNNQKSTPYNPNHPPLYNKHLQPSAPPPSIGKKQLKLFQRVLNRRLSQLHSFTLDTHKSLYDHLTIGKTDKAGSSSSTSNNNNNEIPITNKEIQELFQKLSNKKPKGDDKDHYISLVEYLLIENFHCSSDNRLDTSLRSHCLQKVKYILASIDDCYKEELDQTSKKQKEKEISAAAAGTTATATAAATTTMGARSSKPVPNKNKEKEVIVLDDDDDEEEEEAEQQQQQQQQVEKSKNSALDESSTKKSNKNEKSNTTQSSKPQDSSISKAATSNSIESTSTATATKSTSSTNKPKFNFVPSTKIPPSQEFIPAFDSSKNNTPYLNTGHLTQSNNVGFTFLPDSKNGYYTFSNSLQEYERSRCEITINTSFESCQRTIAKIKSTPIPPPNASSIPHTSIFLDGPALAEFESRLRKWDPYWKIISNCSTFRCQTQQGSGETIVGYKSTNIVSQRMESPLTKKDGLGLPRTSCVIPIQLKNLFNQKHLHDMIWKEMQWGVSKAGNSTSHHNIRYADKEKRLIVRALPLVPNPKYQKIRSDTHQWPKGTFLQLDSKMIQIVAQRKQQQHDPKLWKGLSGVLDLTEHLSAKDMYSKFRQNMPMNLSFCFKDGEMYGIQIALCEYISHDALFNICMSQGTKGSIAKMNYTDGLRHAMKHFEKETLVLDSDSDDDDKNNDNKKSSSGSGDGIKHLTCSLICPVSMQVIKTPVRGKKCKHLNCFDLGTYLENNSKVSGGRWRCFICEDFIPIDDLVYDGFTAQVLETHQSEINTTRDKMQLSNDGTWKLLEETATSSMKRNMKKRSMKESNNGSSKKARLTNPSGEAEVIDIDD